MSNTHWARVDGDAGRTVYGPVISNVIRFELTEPRLFAAGAQASFTAKLRADDQWEVWLASCDDQLSSLEGTLELYLADPATAHSSRNCLIRSESYKVRLYFGAEELAKMRTHLADRAQSICLQLEFDVEYLEGYESPGGYSEAHGIRYWDDVVYPQVPIYRHDFGSWIARDIPTN